MPLFFVENRGKLDAAVAYYVQGKDKTLYFTPEGVTYALAGKDRRWVVKQDFVGADRTVRPRGDDKLDGVVSYFRGSPDARQTGLPTWSRIVYRGLWPGVDLAFSGTANALKSEMVVRPGSDPSRIRFAYRGAEKIRLSPAGELEIVTPDGGFKDSAPEAWQDIDGAKAAVPISYDFDAASHEVGFRLGAYDPSRPLLIDPTVLVYCGFIGGSFDDWGRDIAVDGAGCAYVAGSTASSESVGFPVTVGPDSTFNGSSGDDAFIAKINATGSGFVYCGFIGGSAHDIAYGVAVDGSGCAYLTGLTNSSESSFPESQGPDLSFNGGSYDAFVAKVNAAGTALVYCGYIGGAGDDQGNGIAVDGSGNAYVTGYTASTETSFPVTAGPDLTHNGGSYDAFVAKIGATGASFIYCGFVGDAGRDFGEGVAVDGTGNAYVAGTMDVLPPPGRAFSSASSSSSRPRGLRPSYDSNAFVAKVLSSGASLAFMRSVGGAGRDYGYSIAVDGAGCAFMAGETYSDQASFPVAVGPDLTFNGGSDAFVAKLNAAGTGFLYCGYIGGAGYDSGRGVALDGSGNAYAMGTTGSDETTFPVLDGPGLAYQGSPDLFVAKVLPSGSALGYCGYVGGGGEEFAGGIAVDAIGNAYVSGSAENGSAYDLPVLVGPDFSYNGGLYDAFVAKVSGGGWIKVASPNGSESWEVGSQHPIAWLTGNKAGLNKIVYSTDQGQNWKEIVFATPDDGQYLWTVPGDVSKTCWVRVAEREGPGFDRSDRVFAIVPKPTVKVLSPNGGESWKAGTSHAIRWTTTGTIGNVKVTYSTDGGTNWKTIEASTANDGSLTWVVPNAPSAKCLIKVRDAADGEPLDKSDAVFSIVAD
jgi:hypothetical protein